MDPHGLFDLKFENQILYIAITGQCNKEGFEQVFIEIKELVSQKMPTEFSILVDLTDWGLSEPGVADAFEDMRPWLIERGQKYEVLVVGQSNLKKMETLKYFVGYDERLSVHYCASVTEAEQWLKVNHML